MDFERVYFDDICDFLFAILEHIRDFYNTDARHVFLRICF